MRFEQIALGKMLTARLLSATSYGGVAVFLLVVLVLHGAQRGYDARTQFMSELAMAPHGAWLLLAFVGLFLAVAATALNLRGRSRLLAVLLGIAAVLFLATGVVTLADSPLAHLVFIASAFILSGSAMYMLPRVVAAFANTEGYLISWGCGVLMCGAIGQGDRLILPGIAQRLAAFALLFWLIYVARKLARE